MAVSTTTTYSGPYFPNGVTVEFPFDFKVVTADEIAVLLRDADGNDTEASSADYTVALSGDGGTVTFAVAPAEGPELYIASAPLFTQDAIFSSQKAYSPTVLNSLFDRGVVRDQTLKEQVARSMLAPLGEVLGPLPRAVDRKSRVLGFDDTTGDPIAVPNDSAAVASDVLAAQAASVDAIAAKADAEAGATTAESAAIGAAASRVEAESYAGQATLAAASMGGVYPAAASANVPRGVSSSGAVTPGTGGTNGTYALAFTGGNFNTNPTGTFTVAGGVLTAVSITGPGRYIGASPTAPTASFAASAGLTGAAVVLNVGFLVASGASYWVENADGNNLDLYQNAAGVATISSPLVQLPRSARIDGVLTQAKTNALVPNHLTPSEAVADDFRRISKGSTSILERVVVNGEPCFKLTAPAGVATAFAEFRLPRSSFLSSARFAAGLTLVSVDAGPVGNNRMMKRSLNADGGSLGGDEVLNYASTTGFLVSDLNPALNANDFHASAVFGTLYIELKNTGGATPRSVVFKAPWLSSGQVTAFRTPAPASGTRDVFISPDGDDAKDGSRTYPMKTLTRALDKIDGHGRVVMLYGTTGLYGAEQLFRPEKVRGRVQIVGERDLTANKYPTIIMGDKVTSVTKTAGQVKVYQATVAGITLADLNWIWQYGIPDARTLIAADKRFPQHKGRTHRLLHTKIVKVTDTSSKAAALAEIDAAADPRCYYEAGVLYFSVDETTGQTGITASVYVSNGTGLVYAGTRGAYGELVLNNLDILFGDLTVTPFAAVGMNNVSVIGGKTNCISHFGPFYGGVIETAGAGSMPVGGTVGDGFNGHNYNAAIVTDLYTHDNVDDGESCHEWGSVRISGLAEYNGGAGFCPAYGCDAIYTNAISHRNQQVSGRKPGGFAVVGAPADGGVDTRGQFKTCISIGDDVGFYADTAQSCFGEAINCKAIDPISTGYVGMVMRDCTHSGTGTAKGTGCTVANTALVA